MTLDAYVLSTCSIGRDLYHYADFLYVRDISSVIYTIIMTKCYENLCIHDIHHSFTYMYDVGEVS